jgi:TOBE domain
LYPLREPGLIGGLRQVFAQLGLRKAEGLSRGWDSTLVRAVAAAMLRTGKEEMIASGYCVSCTGQNSTQRLEGSGQDGQSVVVKGRIVQRSFLGEHWDYLFGPENSALRLKVATQPSQVHDVGSVAWLSIDPKLMVAIT